MLEQVINILAEFTMLEREEITEKSNLVIDLGFNSLDIINAVVAFEDAFHIEIPDYKIKDFVTVEDIIDYVEEHV